MESKQNSISSEQIELINQVLAASTDHIYISDRQLRYLYASPAALAALGLKQEQMLGKTWQELGFPAEVMEAYDVQRKYVFQTGIPIRDENSFPTVNGIKYYEYVVSPIWGNDGEIQAVINAGRDVTERKQAQEALHLLTEELEARVAARTQELTALNESLLLEIDQRQQAQQALQESEMQFQALVNAIFEGIIIQENGKIIEANPGFARMFGYTLEEVIGKSAVDFLTPESLKTVLHHIENQYELPYEMTGIKKDGSLISLEVVDKQSFYQGRRVRVSAVRDITERKQAQQKIHEQAALIDVATDAIFVCDLENHVLLWSRGAEVLYGWLAEEIVGQLGDQIFTTESSSQLELGFAATIKHGSWQGDLEQITKTGRKIIVASRWTLVQNLFGHPQSILIVNTNITEKKQLEQQFYRAQRLESVGTLVSGIAHDLNNVFAPILMIAQLLPSKCKNADVRTQELFHTLEQISQRGADLVKQILTFARGTESQSILLQPGHLFKELIKVIKQTFPKSIEIITDIPTSTLWMVQADPTQIEQVFMNLVVNARDAMPYGGTLTITVENQIIDETYTRTHLEATVGSYIVINILDTGTGIAPEFLDRIFDPFFTTKEVGQGTGLGLSTVLGIVKNYKGFVEVSTEVGQGTHFQVFLPRAEGIATKTITNIQLPLGNGELILVVDDEAVFQLATQEILAEYNYRTLVASDGIEAFALYIEHQPEISAVLLDMSMPKADGLTTIRTLRTFNPNVKIIAVSGLPNNEQKAIAAGADKFLSKPYTTTNLLTSLSELIHLV
ncbi:two-component hybrid sensor and regulator [Nostoc sp. NIES-3756]|uniref:PAS domain-containing hybrid sensor histidine kinase/response regulator n=1 Tax=Nostoc sp. NIES-3756 TaxID=1751286 RepID=UPI000722CE48|nr:PAS domain S-box protein [Nostoc sp. NIES-3756]BAT54365.1 two-component hybrid sensor and regulator [Nostoc sp. NIES-3756]BAY37890.1 two-component hybrid sensor and regulator [Nostoc sp. NIES-2111]